MMILSLSANLNSIYEIDNKSIIYFKQIKKRWPHHNNWTVDKFHQV